MDSRSRVRSSQVRSSQVRSESYTQLNLTIRDIHWTPPCQSPSVSSKVPCHNVEIGSSTTYIPWLWSWNGGGVAREATDVLLDDTWIRIRNLQMDVVVTPTKVKRRMEMVAVS